LLSTADTIHLVLDGESMRFKECWKLYVDHGALQEQNLESVGNTGENKICISEMFLVSINELTLTLEVVIFTPTSFKDTDQKRKTIVINKSDVKGILLHI
jgi:hypothetical protein